MRPREQVKKLAQHANSSRESHSDDPEQPEDPEQSFGGKECGMCQDVPESIIYLSCDHIVCLVCAAKLILSAADIREVDFSEVGCGLCGETTELSKEVQETLIEFLNSGEFEIEEDQDDNPEEEEQDEDGEQEDGEDEEEEEEEEEEDENDEAEQIPVKNQDSLNQSNQQDSSRRLVTLPHETEEEDQRTARAKENGEDEENRNSVRFNESSQSHLKTNSFEKAVNKLPAQTKQKSEGRQDFEINNTHEKPEQTIKDS